MKEIELSQNQVAIVDDGDYERLNRRNWYSVWYPSTRSYYAVGHTQMIHGKRRNISMAREILGLKKGDGKQADHRNHNTLDNQRCNLRICNHQENGQNRLKNRTYAGKKCSSVYKGVCWRTRVKKWESLIEFNGNSIFIGYFDSEVEAAHAYDTGAKELFGQFANPNF